MEEYSLKILDIKSGLRLTESRPAISYSEEFFKFTEKMYGVKGGFLSLYKNEELIALMPVNITNNKLFSVYKDYSEPVILKEIDENIWPILMAKLKKEFGFDFIEFNFSISAEYLNGKYFRNTGLSRFVLTINNEESKQSLLRNFDKKTRNEIRKAEKNNFEVKIGPIDNIRSVYDLYAENMNRHGTPIKGMDLFENLASSYGNKLQSVLIYDSGKLVGANIFILNNNYLKLLYNFSKKEYWNRCINNLLYYKMIEWGNQNGIRIFDFGPSSEKDQSHNHFKLGFGGKKIPLLKLASGSKSYLFMKWLEGKKYNLKLKINKYGFNK